MRKGTKMRVSFIIIFLICAIRIQSAEEINYTKDVMPILKQNCFKCHYDKKKKGDFSFLTKESILKGGKEGKDKDVIPGNSKDSILIKLILSKDSDEYMPPKGARLTEAEINTLKKWIDLKIPMDEGAKKVEEKEDNTPKK
jgi:mono/diheme cytochrome c family protein